MRNPFSVLLISPFIFASLNPSAFAKPYHIAVESIPAIQSTNCVYPDGSTPRRSEIHCYTPQELLKAYGIDKLHAMGLTGKGQTIILADSFGSPTMQQDLDHFSDTFGLPHTTIEFIYPNGTYVNDLSTSDQVGWATETTLDLEWAHAIAPDAKLVNIITNNSETVGLTGFPDLFRGIQMAITKYPGAIISMSYGTGEPTFTASDIQNYLKGSFHQIFQDATNAGISLLASSGDSGSTNVGTDAATMVPYPNAGYPASDPLVTAVGGTALETGWKWTPEGTIDEYWNCQLSHSKDCHDDFMASVASSEQTESVWKEDWAFAAGGGGVSTIFDAPAYQANVNADTLKIMHGRRGLPDISLNAAINGGVDIYTSYVAPQFGANGPSWMSTGGTSCASPETAALIALAGQKASETAGQSISIGSLNPLLYSLSNGDFNDIVAESFGADGQVKIDNNSIYFNQNLYNAGISNLSTAVMGYTTTPGYDLATGLGTPKGVQFVLDLANARVKQLSRLP